MLRAFLLLSVAAFLTCGAATPAVLVSGRVVDENNTAVPLAGIVVKPVSSDPKQAIRTSTGPAGVFLLRLPAPGKFLVTVKHSGFFPLEDKPVEILNSSQSLILVLNHVTEIFSSVQVRGDSEGVNLEQTNTVKSLTSDDIVNIPYQGRDVAYALKLLPGVVQDQLGGLHLSGSALNQVLYTLDGFNVTDPLRGTFNTRLNVDAVRSIDYSTARYSPEFGKGSAGTVAIGTRMGGNSLRYNATNFVPGIDTNSGLHIGTWSPRFEISGPVLKKRIWFAESGTATYSQFVVENVKGPNRAPTLRLDNLLRSQVNLSETHQVIVSFLFNSSNSPHSGLTALDPYSTTVDRRSRTWFFSIKQENYLRNGAVVEWGYAENRTFGRQIPQGPGIYGITPFGRAGNYFLNSIEEASRKQFLLNYSPRVLRKWGTHQLKVGIDLDRLNYHARNGRTGYELWSLSGKRLNQVTFAGSGVFSRPNFEAAWYAVDSWNVRPSLTIELGARQDWDELLRNRALSPRISAAWSPFRRKNTKLTGGYAITRDATSLEVFSRPLDQCSVTVNFDSEGRPSSTPATTYFRAENRGLKTPLYRNWTAGVEQRLPRNLSLTVDYMRKRGDDGLTYLALPGVNDPAVNAIFELRNYRRDVFDSVETTVRQSFGKEYEWMASYTRSRALSNSVINLSVDQPLWVTNNVGRMPWDSPNHLLAWGIFPTPLRNWSVAFALDVRDGFPFSVVNDWNATVGEVNSYRYPMYFDLDLHLEKRLRLGKRLVALRGGYTNITNHQNPTVVNNMIGAPEFLRFYGSSGRHVVFRLRWLGTRD